MSTTDPPLLTCFVKMVGVSLNDLTKVKATMQNSIMS